MTELQEGDIKIIMQLIRNFPVGRHLDVAHWLEKYSGKEDWVTLKNFLLENKIIVFRFDGCYLTQYGEKLKELNDYEKFEKWRIKQKRLDGYARFAATRWYWVLLLTAIATVAIERFVNYLSSRQTKEKVAPKSKELPTNPPPQSPASNSLTTPD